MTNFEPRMPGIPRSQGLLAMGKDPSQPDVHGEAERCAWGKISPFPHGLRLPGLERDHRAAPARLTFREARSRPSVQRFRVAGMDLPAGLASTRLSRIVAPIVIGRGT